MEEEAPGWQEVDLAIVINVDDKLESPQETCSSAGSLSAPAQAIKCGARHTENSSRPSGSPGTQGSISTFMSSSHTPQRASARYCVPESEVRLHRVCNSV